MDISGLSLGGTMGMGSNLHNSSFKMQADLRSYFGPTSGVDAWIVQMPLRYGVLRLSGSKDKAISLLTQKSLTLPKGEMVISFTNTPFYRSLFRLLSKVPLNKYSGQPLNRPLVDSTGLYDALVSAYLPASIPDGWSVLAINKELKKYGMHIEIVEQSVPRLEIYEINREMRLEALE